MDEELIEGILREDEKVVLAFIQIYQDKVYSQAFRMLKNSQDAEEVSQDVFLKALNKINTFKQDSKLSTWIYRITFNTCQDFLKKKKRRPVLVEIDQAKSFSWEMIQDTLYKLEMKEQRSIIDKAIEQLEQTDALLIELYHLQELPISEIAEITLMKEGAIKVRLMRARKKLSVHLEALLPKDTINKFKKKD